MKFSVDKHLTFDQAVELMFEKLGDWKIMALASSDNYAYQIFIDFDKEEVTVKPYDKE